MLTRALPTGAVQVARDVTEVDQILGQLRRQLLVLAIGGAAVAGLLGWWLARRLTQPLEELTEVAERVARDEDLNATVPVGGDDEVGRLARSFDTMLGALATSKEAQRRLVQDASHELRTPLTSLRTNVELLARAPDLDPTVRQEVLDGLTSEVTELSALVDELVQLATDRRDLGEPSPVVLGDIAVDVVDRFRRRTGRTVDVTRVEGNDDVVAHPVLVERAMANVLANAHKFSPSHEPVEVRIGEGGFAVRDHGPGIPPDERELVFQRFYRTDVARDAPGSGLGLAIVRDIVSAYGGTTFVGDAQGGGAVVGFRLPVQPVVRER
jgi:two-component system sensor histidine kinase MprB